MTRRFLVRLPCMERRPAEAAVRFAWGAPERRNPVAAGASDRIGMRFACHRGGDRECIIGAVSSLRFPMRKLLILALVALMVSGCDIVYRQPIYQGNLLAKSPIHQLQPGMSHPQVIDLLCSPSITNPSYNQRWGPPSTPSPPPTAPTQQNR